MSQSRRQGRLPWVAHFNWRVVEMRFFVNAVSLTVAALIALREATKRLPSIQDAIPKWLDQFQRGQVTLKLDTSDLKKQVKGLSSIARGVMVGALITGVIVASAIVQNSDATGAVARLADLSCVLFAIIGAIAVLAVGWRLIRRDPESARRRP